MLAFTAGDWLLYGGGSLAAAYGLATDRAPAWSVLCLHAGAGIFVATKIQGAVEKTCGFGDSMVFSVGTTESQESPETEDHT